VPVEDVAHALGVTIVRGELESALALLVRAGRRSRIRVSDAHVDPGQLRFSIAHELGHFVLGRAAMAGSRGEVGVGHGVVSGEAEAEANAFAAELLLPDPQVRPRCRGAPVDFAAVDAIAQDFGTSIVAAAIRFAELTPERVAVAYRQGGELIWLVPSGALMPLLRSEATRSSSPAVADRYGTRRMSSRAGESIDWFAWGRGRTADCKAKIVEHSRKLDYVDAVLSLIWIPSSSSVAAHQVA
jgi:hypothetical protein